MLHLISKSPTKYDKHVPIHLFSFGSGGAVRSFSGGTFSERLLDKYEFIYVLSGALHITVNKNEIALGSDQFILIPPYHRLSGGAPSPDNTRCFLLSFYCDYPELLPKSLTPGSAGDPYTLQSLMDMLCAHLNAAQTDTFACDCLALLILNTAKNAAI